MLTTIYFSWNNIYSSNKTSLKQIMHNVLKTKAKYTFKKLYNI